MKTLLFLSVLLLVASVQPAQAGRALAGSRSSELSLARSEPVPGGGDVDTTLRKSPAHAFVLSLIVPGLGQHYNGQHGKGALQEVLFVGGVFAFAGGLAVGWNDPSEGGAAALCATGAIMTVGSYVWSVVDAPASANRINKELDERESQ